MNSTDKTPSYAENPLGILPVNKLLTKFAIPSIVAMLVTSMYNMVDQIFIGNAVGELGNAATNIAFPLTTMCTATALTFGIGGASAFNLSMGMGEKDKAGHYIGNAVVGMLSIGVLISLIALVFLTPLLKFFGSPADVLPYAREYTSVTAFGFPFLILSAAGGHLIRADGKPGTAMICNLVGAVVNTALDALFVMGFHWDMKGAAIATVISQIIAAALITYHLIHFRTLHLTAAHFVPRWKYLLRAASLGMSQGFNQLAMMVVQIVLNNSLKYYGARSVYGESIPIAVVGVITKVNMLYFSFCIGLSQGMQPIASFNYGAGRYGRVKQAYRLARNTGTIISIAAFLLFQFFPRQIVSIFGNGSEEYFLFAVNYFRIYLFFTFVNNIQPLTSNFFSSIGKPKTGLFLSLTRQILFLLPLILLFPVFWGINGIMYAGPIADGLAFTVSTVFIIRELHRPEYKSKVS